jgi:hypothetical protein
MSCKDVGWIHLDQDRLGEGYYEHINESSSSKMGEEFFDQLSDYQFLEKDCPPWSYTLYLLINGLVFLVIMCTLLRV